MYFMTLILLLREEEAALPGAGEGLALDRGEGAGLVRDADGPVLAVLNIQKFTSRVLLFSHHFKIFLELKTGSRYSRYSCHNHMPLK